MQHILSVGAFFKHKGQATWVESVRETVLQWLTEQHDIQERKETASLVMEGAIVVLVAAELFFSIANFVSSKCAH